jgi:hypothetical protein
MDFENNPKIAKLRNATRYVYDIQKIRIQVGNRAGKQADHAKAALDEEDKRFLKASNQGLKNLEEEGFKELLRLLKGIPIWEKWLKHEVLGVGPAMAGVLLSELDIEEAIYPSKFWAVSGLAVDNKTGRAVRRVKGQKLNYNPWLKSKLLEVMGKCMIKNGAPVDAKDIVVKKTGDIRKRKAKPASKWYDIYVNRKHRRKTQMLDVCMACEGSGKLKIRKKKRKNGEEFEVQEPASKKAKKGKEVTEEGEAKVTECGNCGGTGGPAPWGRSDAHRELDARRYMVKMFLAEFWERWRKFENLPIRPTYHEERQGHVFSGKQEPKEEPKARKKKKSKKRAA